MGLRQLPRGTSKRPFLPLVHTNRRIILFARKQQQKFMCARACLFECGELRTRKTHRESEGYHFIDARELKCAPTPTETRTHTHTHARTHVHRPTCTYSQAHARAYTHARTSTRAGAHSPAHGRTHPRTHALTRTRPRVQSEKMEEPRSGFFLYLPLTLYVSYNYSVNMI